MQSLCHTLLVDRFSLFTRGSDSTYDMSNETKTTSNEPLDLNILVDENFDYLYRYAFRYFRKEEVAEDLVQETFLAATTALKRFQGGSTPRTWLTSILKHKILDRMRVKDREEPIDFNSLEKDSHPKLFNEAEHWHNETGPIFWGASPDSEIKQKQFFTALERCLTKLPSQFRQIFLLRELDGLERGEICEKLELTSSNVGVILHRCRLALQACLQTTWFCADKAGGKS